MSFSWLPYGKERMARVRLNYRKNVHIKRCSLPWRVVPIYRYFSTHRTRTSSCFDLTSSCDFWWWNRTSSDHSSRISIRGSYRYDRSAYNSRSTLITCCYKYWNRTWSRKTTKTDISSPKTLSHICCSSSRLPSRSFTHRLNIIVLK